MHQEKLRVSPWRHTHLTPLLFVQSLKAVSTLATANRLSSPQKVAAATVTSEPSVELRVCVPVLNSADGADVPRQAGSIVFQAPVRGIRLDFIGIHAR